MNSRDERDVRWGGWVGILLAVLVAGVFRCYRSPARTFLYGVQDFNSIRHSANGRFAKIAIFMFASLRCADAFRRSSPATAWRQ